MKNHDLIAFYQTRDEAEKVRDDLLDAGFDRDDVKVYANDHGEGGGFWDSIKEAFGYTDEEDKALYSEAARRGASAVAVSLDDPDGPSAQQALPIIERYKPIDLDRQAALWRQQGWAPPATPAATTTASTSARRPAPARPATGTRARTENLSQGQASIPVVEEQLRVGKRRVANGGVRIYSHVTQKPVEENVQLREERVNVERRPVDRPVTDADQAFRERAVEATAMREEAVVDKKARVVEEVRVNKEAQQHTETVRDNVRRTDVEVERLNPGQSSEFADTFAAQLANDQRFRGQDWRTVEPEARRNFEQRYGTTDWDKYKDAVRNSWDRVRSRT